MNDSQQRVSFRLAISADTWLSYYQGIAKSVSLVADDGRRIEFPAEHLRPFVSHSGVYGKFQICFDANNRFVEIQKLTD